MKKKIAIAVAVILALFSLSMAIFANPFSGKGGRDRSGSESARNPGKIVLGFSQIGAESEWRIANTRSIQKTACEAGIELIFADAQYRQENQIMDVVKSLVAGQAVPKRIATNESVFDQSNAAAELKGRQY